MPSASQPAPALRDRAERHVFALLPELPAAERRVLALLELAGEDRSAVARDTGLEDVPLRFAAKRARKALRRTRAPLPAGARCERAELLASDRADAPLRREDRKWLEIHLARCPRCARHAELLEQARADLRATFDAQPPRALPPAPEPPALPAPERRAELRVVPEPPPEPAPAPREAPEQEAPPAPAPAPRPAAPAAEAPPPAKTAPPTDVAPPAPPAAPRPAVAPKRTLSPAARRALRVVALLLVLAGLVAAAAAGIAALSDDGPPQHAPWDQPNAPEVRPAPLIDQ